MANHTILSMYHLRPRRIGGIEVMIRELSLQLAQHQWRSVVCFAGPPSDQVRQFLELSNVAIEVISDWRTWSFRFNWKVVHLLRRHRPAVVHLNFMHPLGPQVRLARLLGASRVCFTDHNSRPVDYQPHVIPSWKQAIYRAVVPVSRVLCVSDYVRRCGIESGIYEPDRYRTLYNGVDIERSQAAHQQRMRFRQRFAIPSDAVVVAQVAKLIPEKGFELLLKAARIVAASESNTWFVLAGDGPERSKYQSIVNASGLADRVQLTGLIEDPVGEGLFAAADIVCQASVWNEAFGLVIAEAMAAGKPVVATRVGGIPELIMNGKTGYLVDRDDAPGLAACISRLAGDPKLRQELGAAGQVACSERFDSRLHASKLIAEYQVVDSCELSYANGSQRA